MDNILRTDKTIKFNEYVLHGVYYIIVITIDFISSGLKTNFATNSNDIKLLPIIATSHHTPRKENLNWIIYSRKS